MSAPVRILNDTCPDCGRVRCLGPSIMPGTVLVCCAGEKARLRDALAQGRGVEYVKPLPIAGDLFPETIRPAAPLPLFDQQ